MPTANPPPKLACPHCHATIKAPALPAGSLVNCPKCGQAFRLGEKSEEGRESGVGSQESAEGGQRSEVRGQAGGERAGNAAAKSAPVPPQPGTKHSLPSTPPHSPPTNPLSKPGTEYLVPSTRPKAAPPPPPPGPVASSPLATDPPSDPAVHNPKSKIQNLKSPRPPDNLVDPNLLPPPPPVVKPKPTQVAVVCPLCHTRIYVPLEKIGQTIKCPDCHSENEVKAPHAPKNKNTGPTLDDAEDFAMSDPGQRPAYRPMVAPRGEYEVLSALDPSAVAHGWKLPAAAAQPTAEEEAELQLEAPVERVELAPEPIKRPVAEPEPDWEDKLRDGRYDDGLIGANVDRREPEAWKKSPFLIGVVEFLIQPETLGRLAAYAVGLAMLFILGSYTVSAATSDTATGQLVAVVLSMFSAVGFGMWVMTFSATLLAIVQDTGNGADEVNSWPSWDPTQWFFPALFVVGAVLVSGLPGMVITTVLFASAVATSGFASSLVVAVILSLPLPLSWLALLPIVLYSMLAENSLFAVASRHAMTSLRVASEGWMLFYMISLLLFIVIGAVGSLVFLNNVLALSVGAAGLVILAFLYARLLGRLMWYSGQEVAKVESADQ